MRYSPSVLREIRASIDEALVRREVLCESPEPLGPQPAHTPGDYSRSVSISSAMLKG